MDILQSRSKLCILIHRTKDWSSMLFSTYFTSSLPLKYLLFIFANADTTACESEERLFHKLFSHYNQFIRPVENVSDPVTVHFELAITQLTNVVRLTTEDCWDLGMIVKHRKCSNSRHTHDVCAYSPHSWYYHACAYVYTVRCLPFCQPGHFSSSYRQFTLYRFIGYLYHAKSLCSRQQPLAYGAAVPNVHSHRVCLPQGHGIVFVLSNMQPSSPVDPFGFYQVSWVWEGPSYLAH